MHASVAHWALSHSQKVVGSIPSQGIIPGWGPGAYRRQPINVSLPP